MDLRDFKEEITMSYFNDWYEDEHSDDYDKVSSVSVFPNKKSSRIRRREFIKNRINKDS